jgi:hypothetical protein
LDLVVKTTAKGVVATGNKANEYVNPGEGAIYEARATSIHGLTATHPSIRYAEEIHP